MNNKLVLGLLIVYTIMVITFTSLWTEHRLDVGDDESKTTKLTMGFVTFILAGACGAGVAYHTATCGV